MALISRFGASVGFAAALSMVSIPAVAAEAPQAAKSGAAFVEFDSNPFGTSIYNGDTDVSEWRRGWRRGGWRRGRGRVRAGDILTGVLILGGIAAVASAANNNNRRNRDRDVVVVERDRDDRRDNRRNYRDDRRDNGTRGLDSAVDQCVDEIQRDVRVDSVNSVDRTARGWVVTGALFNGSGFTCAIDNNGKIDAIEYGDFRGSSFDGSNSERRAQGQYDDDTYRNARLTMDGALGGNRRARTYEATGRSDEPLVEIASDDRRPAYPGGPLPGEDFPE